MTQDPQIAALAPELDAGLLQLSLDRALAPTLLAYLSVLKRWNQSYNLTAVKEPIAMLRLHLLDCLAAAAPIATRLALDQPLHFETAHAVSAKPLQLVDVGSGGGLPGVVFALLWPNHQHHLVDTVGKKAAFLNQCKLQLKMTQITVHHHRIETLALPPSARPRHFTCRAFASLKDFVAQTWHLSSAGSQWFALKGQEPSAELRMLEAFCKGIPESTLDFETLTLHPPGLETTQRHLICLKRYH